MMSTKQPNILVVLCDQLRRQALRCYGDPNIHTPHLDAMANHGVRFDAACSSYPICVPFRFTLLTGQCAHSRHVRSIHWRLSPTERTLADEFNAADYDTSYFGKWHLADVKKMQPVPRELQGRFQRFVGFDNRNNHFQTVCFENDSDTPIPLAGYQTDRLVDLAMDHLAERTPPGRPFFCMVSVEPPHPPFEAPPDYQSAWADRPLTLPPNFMTAVHHDRLPDALPLDDQYRSDRMRDLRIYYAMIQNLDDNVGRLMAFLQQRDLARHTIVVFLSDHGSLLGSHGLGAKSYPYEESIGIPLLVWGPGCGIPQGRVVSEPVSSEDLYPTLCGLANLPCDASLPGLDCTPLLRGQAKQLDRSGVMLEYVEEHRPARSLYQMRYRGFRSRTGKYTVLGRHDAPLRPWQFFDLERDPYEMNNLIDEPACKAVIGQHHEWLRLRMTQTADPATLAGRD